MAHCILVSDVFCPWCYGFSPIMRRIVAEHNDWTIRILLGNLVEEPTTLEAMQQEHPNLRAFFGRLTRTTGQPVGEGFLHRLEPGHGDLRLYSPEMAVPLTALQKLVPGQALEQLEAFQKALYGTGLDILNPDVQARTAGVEPDVLARAMQDADVQKTAQREREEALELLGDFVVYPSLFLETEDGQRHMLARGYTAYETVASRIANAIGSGNTTTIRPSAEACGLDGACPF